MGVDIWRERHDDQCLSVNEDNAIANNDADFSQSQTTIRPTPTASFAVQAPVPPPLNDANRAAIADPIDSSEAVCFRLLIGFTSNGVLILDDSLSNTLENSNEVRSLFNAFSWAVSLRRGMVQEEEFIWPILAEQQDQRMTTARRVLGTHIQRWQLKKTLKAIILLGSMVQSIVLDQKVHSSDAVVSSVTKNNLLVPLATASLKSGPINQTQMLLFENLGDVINSPLKKRDLWSGVSELLQQLSID